MTQLTENGKSKMDDYISSYIEGKDKEKILGKFEVSIRSMEYKNIYDNYGYENNHDYIEYLIYIKIYKKIHEIIIYHYKRWPDYGIPKDIDQFKKFHIITQNPGQRNILVHCSAGVGRSGVYVVYDILY